MCTGIRICYVCPYTVTENPECPYSNPRTAATGHYTAYDYDWQDPSLLCCGNHQESF